MINWKIVRRFQRGLQRIENKGRILNTRVKLRVDTNKRWESSSSSPLREGEIGIGYDISWNRDKQTYEKTNFKIKIGRTLLDSEGKPTRFSSIWNDAADLNVVLTQEQKAEIIEQIKPDLSASFVTKDDFDTALSAVDVRLNAIETRLSDRVTAWVSNTLLYLSEGVKPVII